MEDFEVTIVRTITTVVKVNSANLAAASRQVLAYGCIEAANDYAVLSEDVQAKLTKVKPCTS